MFLESFETFLRKKIWKHFFGVDAVHICHRSKRSQNTIFELKSKNGEKNLFSKNYVRTHYIATGYRRSFLTKKIFFIIFTDEFKKHVFRTFGDNF